MHEPRVSLGIAARGCSRRRNGGGAGDQYATQDRVATAAAEENLRCARISRHGVRDTALDVRVCQRLDPRRCPSLLRDRAGPSDVSRPIGGLNQRQVPRTALVLQAVWISVLCLSGTYAQLIQFVIFVGAAVLRRDRPPDYSRSGAPSPRYTAAVSCAGDIRYYRLTVHCPDLRDRADARDRAREPGAVAARITGRGVRGARVSGVAGGGSRGGGGVTAESDRGDGDRAPRREVERICAGRNTEDRTTGIESEHTVDLNADLGEGFGPYRLRRECGADAAAHVGQHRVRVPCGRSDERCGRRPRRQRKHGVGDRGASRVSGSARGSAGGSSSATRLRSPHT